MKRIDSIETLNAVLASSATRPVLIFKHSLACGTSAMALEEMEDLDIYLVEIQLARDVSRAIEDRLRIRHESPQILLVVDGRAVWHASHFRVTATAVRAAVAAHPLATASQEL